MAKTIQLQIVTPQRIVFSGEVESFTAPGALGPFQVLHNHAPIVSTLVSGTFRFRDAKGHEERYHVSGGFLELHQNNATVLADTAEATA